MHKAGRWWLAIAMGQAVFPRVFGDDAWPACTVGWEAGAQPAASDVSFLLEAPAGRDGFLRAKDGRLVRPDGRRFRIWGINATGAACLPPTNSAPAIAGRLAACGINCVRFHFLDKPGTLIDGGRADTRALDPAALGRLDFFVAELKRRGIYSDLNLNVYRTYKAGDGVRDAERLGIGKGATYFDPRLLELQREYARQLLAHTNAFTGRPYADEPAVALVEFVNENSIVEAWMSGRLEGTQTNRPSGTWHDIPPSYAEDLTRRFNGWLAKNAAAADVARWRTEAGVPAGAPLPRLRKAQIAKASQDRFRAEASFYVGLERAFFRDMARCLREELGVKSLLAGNSDHNHGLSGYPLTSSLATLDVVDSHVYWQHPRYRSDAGGRRAGFDIANTPMVDRPERCTAVELSRTAVAGRPFTVSEVNHPFPSEYACEGVPLLAAYGAMQDWDGIFWYTLAHADVATLPAAVKGHFDFAMDPVKMAQLPAGALLFLRGDAAPARRTVTRSYSREQVLDSLRMPWSDGPYFTPGFPPVLPLIHGARVTSFDGPPTAAFDPVDEGEAIRSDTGELTWRAAPKGSGFVAVDTPRSQALVGHLAAAGRVRTRNLAAQMRTPFCTLTLGSLDGQPIASSGRMLLTAGARVANTGMRWNDRRTSLDAWGAAPTRIEPVRGSIALGALAAAAGVSAQPLDGSGRPAGAAIPLSRSGADWSLEIGEPAAPAYVVTVARDGT